MNEMIILTSALDGTLDAAERLRAAVIERGHELADEGGKLLAEVTPGESAMPLKLAGEKAKEFAARVEDLRDIGKRIVKDALERTNAAVVLRQIDDRFLSFSSKADAATTYAQLYDIAKEITATVKGRKEAETPAAPVRAIPCIIYATDEAFRKLCADIVGGKRAGMAGYAVASSEAEEKKLLKILAPGAAK